MFADWILIEPQLLLFYWPVEWREALQIPTQNNIVHWQLAKQNGALLAYQKTANSTILSISSTTIAL